MQNRKSSLTKALLVLTLFDVALIIARWYLNWANFEIPTSWEAIKTGRGNTFMFLVWNLFLAWLPYVAARLFNKMDESAMKLWKVLPVFLFWLAFFPNSPYLVTDLIHLQPRVDVPYWFDIALFFSFAVSGLVLGLASMLEIEQVLRRRLSSVFVWPSLLGLIALCSFGVWLGRFHRWKTSEILTNPSPLVLDIYTIFTTQHLLIHALSISVLISGLLTVNYLLVRSFRLVD